MTDDNALLLRYAETGAEEAFAEVVRRNLNLVYATARRHLAESHLAEDVAQSVFIDLARKARPLSRHPALASWLHTSARFAALKALRSARRRRAREHEAHLMQDPLAPDPAPNWEHLSPVLDEALHQLDEGNRQAILLRYFRGLPFAEVAAHLQINEGAARTRVNRALDKLSHLLAGRGIRSTSAALGLALASQPAVAAPATLAATLAHTAVTSAAAGPALEVIEALLLMSKVKLAALGTLVLAVFTTTVIEVQAHRAIKAELAAVATLDPAQLQTENTALRAAAAQFVTQVPDLAELPQLRARLATLKARPPGVTDALLRPARNVGRATPAAAMETFCWAMLHDDLDLVASYVPLIDDSPENREALMAGFSEAVRARYRTPERLLARAFFGIPPEGDSNRPAAVQFLGTEEDDVATKVVGKMWMRLASGRELLVRSRYYFQGDGWTEKPTSITSPEVIRLVRERIDPVTGEWIPPQAPASKKP